MLANSRTIALVTPTGDVTWMCHPEPDSAAVFAHLLGGPEAGHFTIGPARSALPLGQKYIDSTMTVETRWASLQVTDYLAHDEVPGRTDLIRVVTGEADAVVTFAPRPEFGQAPVQLVAEADGLQYWAPTIRSCCGRPASPGRSGPTTRPRPRPSARQWAHHSRATLWHRRPQ